MHTLDDEVCKVVFGIIQNKFCFFDTYFLKETHKKNRATVTTTFKTLLNWNLNKGFVCENLWVCESNSGFAHICCYDQNKHWQHLDVRLENNVVSLKVSRNPGENLTSSWPLPSWVYVLQQLCFPVIIKELGGVWLGGGCMRDSKLGLQQNTFIPKHRTALTSPT